MGPPARSSWVAAADDAGVRMQGKAVFANGFR